MSEQVARDPGQETFDGAERSSGCTCAVADGTFASVPNPTLEELLANPQTTVLVAALSLVYLCVAAAFAAWLRVRRNVRAPYTRKVFHFLAISAVALVHVVWGLAGVLTYGGVAALVVLYAVHRGAGFGVYEALARPADAPHRTLFILVPLLTTALGGALANLLFPGWAHVGYMAVAWGDAAGEPIGTRWGVHRYAVPSLAGVPATRSVEGTAAVLVAASVAGWLALFASGLGASAALPVALAVGLTTAVVEAVSTHGLDNLTIQVAATGVASLLVG